MISRFSDLPKPWRPASSLPGTETGRWDLPTPKSLLARHHDPPSLILASIGDCSLGTLPRRTLGPTSKMVCFTTGAKWVWIAKLITDSCSYHYAIANVFRIRLSYYMKSILDIATDGSRRIVAEDIGVASFPYRILCSRGAKHRMQCPFANVLKANGTFLPQRPPKGRRVPAAERTWYDLGRGKVLRSRLCICFKVDLGLVFVCWQ